MIHPCPKFIGCLAKPSLKLGYGQVIDLLHNSHNTPVPYPTRHHSVTEMCTCVHIPVIKWCIMGYISDPFVGFVKWVHQFNILSGFAYLLIP